jgi:hypothetical protein
MKTPRNVPIMIYIACLALAVIYWLVFILAGMEGLTSTLYFFLLPLIGIPYILWIVHHEGREPEEYFQDTYAGHTGLMWVVRIFMMGVVSTLSSVAAILILGAAGFVYGLFK